MQCTYDRHVDVSSYSCTVYALYIYYEHMIDMWMSLPVVVPVLYVA